MRFYVILVFLMFFTLSVLSAAPSVTNVQGTYVEGNTITITGTSFGPRPLQPESFFEDFNWGQNDFHLDNVAGSTWEVMNHAAPVSFSNEVLRDGSGLNARSIRPDIIENTEQNDIATRVGLNVQPGDKVYLSTFLWSTYQGADQYGSDCPQQWKAWNWLSHGALNPPIAGLTWSDDGDPPGLPDGYVPDGAPHHSIWHDCNDQRFNLASSGTTVLQWRVQPSQENWWQTEIEYKVASGYQQFDGIFRSYFDGLFAGEKTTASWCIPEMDSVIVNDGYVYDEMLLRNYVQWSGACSASREYDTMRFDDIVYQRGTWARVMLGNADTWSGSTVREYQPVTSWNDGSAVITLNQGAFELGDSAWVYVVDDNGDASAGVEIVIGSSSSPVTEPTIYSVSDSTLSDGQSVSIIGAGFGVKDPVAPLRWDDFQDGVVGPASSATRYPDVDDGAVFDTQTGSTDERRTLHYSNFITRYPGDIGLLQDYGTYVPGIVEGPSNNKALGVINVPSYEWYATWWAYRDDYEGNALLCENTKLYGNFAGGPWTGLPESRWEQYFAGESGHMQMNDCNGDNQANNWNGFHPRLNEWIRVERYMHKSVDGYSYGKINQEILGEITGNFNVCNLPFETFVMGHYFRTEDGSGASMNQYVSEMYVDLTQARIELCDTNTYDSATHCEIQLPSSGWDDGTGRNIVFTARQGSFSSSDDLFLFVVDADGQVSDGFGPLIFEDGGVSLPGDLDGNGVVNLRDLDAVLSLRDLLVLGRALLA